MARKKKGAELGWPREGGEEWLSPSGGGALFGEKREEPDRAVGSLRRTRRKENGVTEEREKGSRSGEKRFVGERIVGVSRRLACLSTILSFLPYPVRRPARVPSSHRPGLPLHIIYLPHRRPRPCCCQAKSPGVFFFPFPSVNESASGVWHLRF